MLVVIVYSNIIYDRTNNCSFFKNKYDQNREQQGYVNLPDWFSNWENRSKKFYDKNGDE